jgi:hypothetical protein
MEYFKGIINIEASKSMTKEQVYEQLKGKLDVDFDTFYLELTKLNGTYESIEKPSVKSKKS